MISTQNISLRYGGRVLFENVNVKFTKGNCYGLIGANGTGKSTFLNILSGELEPNKGEVVITQGERLAVLKQDHFQYDEYDVVTTVMMGHKRLMEVMKEREEIYSKADFTDEDGIRSGELESEFAELGGWTAESEAETLLNGLGVDSSLHTVKMAELDGGLKVKVLLAQALFGNPDILLLDEPTNHLDLTSVKWLEDFLMDFENIVIVVSHDRHFLNKVCTQILDIDYSKITTYVGNYDFWYQYTQLAQRQLKEQNKRTEARIKELQEFIQRFSANASKSKQATSRKKLLDNLELENFHPSSRRYPFVSFKPDREVGNDLLRVDNLSMTVGGRKVLNNVSFIVQPEDKIAFVGSDDLAKTTLFKVLMGELEPDEGSYKWGITTSQSYFPKDNSEYFDGSELNLIDWLRQYSKDQYETTIRGWLGRILFSGEEALKKASVLSGGERVRCMLCKMMLSGAN
ncbi:MAG: ATP-binding cassette domain-containing protein, partial [Clostridiales bacterium]|nr:ATP-binding cassette domain-containing protein [Clostridiales bacterium]